MWGIDQRREENPLISSCWTSTPGRLDAATQVVGGLVLELLGEERNRLLKPSPWASKRTQSSWFSELCVSEPQGTISEQITGP